MNDADQLRGEIAAACGLPAGSASFLSGSSVEEVEASAESFAALVAQRDQEPEPSGNIIERATVTKAQRKRELADLFSGRSPQPRDEGGRFGGFDGGARQTIPVAQSPERAHAELLGHLVAASRVYRGGF